MLTPAPLPPLCVRGSIIILASQTFLIFSPQHMYYQSKDCLGSFVL